MLNPTVKVKWLKALRSGNYTQTTGRLHNNGAYCCLGVLCAIKGLKLEGTFNTVNAGGELKRAYCEKIGLPYHIEEQLVKMNDDKKSTFNQIADFIEKCEEI